jgi:SagB-type dehydrogenase family enzyme
MNKKFIFIIVLLFCLGLGTNVLLGQTAKAKVKPKDIPMVLNRFDTIKLLSPDTLGGMLLMRAAQHRKTDRDFQISNLTLKHLSEVLWMAYGVNRPSGKRTVPSAKALYPLSVYAVLANGVYLYQPLKNLLVPVVQGDFRNISGGQSFVAKAPLNLVVFSDITKYGDPQKFSELTRVKMCAIDAGHVMQNVYLYCASEGLKCVERASVNESEFVKILGLDEKYRFMIAQTIGY